MKETKFEDLKIGDVVLVDAFDYALFVMMEDPKENENCHSKSFMVWCANPTNRGQYRDLNQQRGIFYKLN